MSNKEKNIGSVSLDLDNQWAYMKVHGDKGWEEYPSYLNTFLPHSLKLLKEHNLNITFFLVGKDVDDPKNKDILKEIIPNNHEIANHSYNHEARFNIYSNLEITEEISKTEEAIFSLTGEKTKGFRGPGFSRSKELFNILTEKSYLYDASTLPTWIGPLARMYYFRQSTLSKKEKEMRKGLFGSFTDGLQRIKPFIWNLNNNNKLLEIPVSTIPLLKVPFHFSYLHYLASINETLMKVYLETAIRFCRITNTEPSFLLHPLDLIGGDLIPELKFFPGMELSSSYKVELFNIVIEKMKSSFKLINMSEHAEIILRRNSNKEKIIN